MKAYERYGFGTIDFRGVFGVEKVQSVFVRRSAWYNAPWGDGRFEVRATIDGALVEMLFGAADLYSPRDLRFMPMPMARELDRLMSEELGCGSALGAWCS